MITLANIKSVKVGNYKISLYVNRNGHFCAHVQWIVQKGPMAGTLRSCYAQAFLTEEKRDQYVADQVKLVNDRIAQKAAEKKANKNESFENPYKVGHIMYTTWGYEQTNVNFYEVVAVTSKSISVREIAAEIVTNEQGGFVGRKRPVAGKFIGEIERKVVNCRVFSNGVVYNVKGLSDYDKGDQGVFYSSYH